VPTVAAFVVTLAGGAVLAGLVERSRLQEERQVTTEIANLHAREIGNRLEHALSATFALAAVVRQSGGHIDAFEPLAAEIIRTYGGIGVLSYAPGGVITKVQPLAGNEKIIGFNPLKDPQQGFEARKAVEQRRLVLTGPFTLRQGGFGVVGRHPVFLGEGTPNERFWGFVHVTLRIDELLAITSVGSLETSGYRYELSRIDPQNGNKVVFARSGGDPPRRPVEAVIVVPGGSWNLGVEARNHGGPSLFVLAEIAGVLALASLAALAMVFQQREPARLRREIEVRRQAERELRRSTARLQEIIDTLDSGLVLWDKEHRLLAWNRAFERMFPEIAPRLAMGLHRRDFAAQMQGFGSFQPGEEAVAGHWDSIGTWDRHLVDGRLIAMQRLATSDGGRLVLHTDVTESRRSAEVLARNERMASLGKLVAGIAHEVNTPIGNALMVASTLRQRIDETEKGVTEATLRRSELMDFLRLLRESDDLVLRNLGRAAELVQHFKQVAVDQVSDRRRRFDLAAVIEEIAATLHVRLRRSAHCLELELLPGLVMDSYPGALGQIVGNLVENSLLHAYADGECGRLRLAVRDLPDGKVELVYSDDGRGIASDQLPRVFDPFYTTRMGLGGSGLGLSIVLNLTRDLLGGDLEIDSRVGDGTRFRLVLPQVAPRRPNFDEKTENLEGLN